MPKSYTLKPNPPGEGIQREGFGRALGLKGGGRCDFSNTRGHRGHKGCEEVGPPHILALQGPALGLASIRYISCTCYGDL